MKKDCLTKKNKKMNTKEKMLYSAIRGTERMSGAAGDEEGDMSYFDDGDYNSFDGDDMSYACGAPAAPAQSDPYVLQYTNTTTGDLTAILFGFNDYSGTTNFGNPVGITITNLQGGTYGRLFNQTQNKNFKIGKWRFECSTSSQLQQTLQIVHVDANGNQQQKPFNLSILKDAYQQQGDIIDVTKVVTVDGNTYLTFTLKAGAVLTISMFPTEIISGKSKLNGGASIPNFKAPRLSALNTAPVIIQTNQGVKGINK